MSLINELCVHLQNADPINLSPDIAVKMVAAIAVNDYKLQQQSNNCMIGGDSHIICDLAALLGVEERREAVFFEVKRLARLADSLSEKDYEDTNRYLKLGYLLKAQLGVEFGPCDEDFDELVLLEIARLKNHVQFTEVPTSAENPAFADHPAAPSNDRQIKPDGMKFNTGEPWKFAFSPDVLVDLLRIICEHGHNDVPSLKLRLRNRTGIEIPPEQLRGILGGWKMKRASGLSLIELFEGLSPSERESALTQFRESLYKRKGSERFRTNDEGDK